MCVIVVQYANRGNFTDSVSVVSIVFHYVLFTAIPKQTKNALFISLIFPEIFNNEKALEKCTYAVKTIHSKKISTGQVYLEKKVKIYSFLREFVASFCFKQKDSKRGTTDIFFLVRSVLFSKTPYCWYGTVNMEDDNGEGRTVLTLHGIFPFRHHMIIHCVYHSPFVT